MSNEASPKATPPMLEAPITLTLDHLTIGDLNDYRQACHAEQWPPANLLGAERVAYVKQQQKLANQAALGIALFLDNQIKHLRSEPIEE